MALTAINNAYLGVYLEDLTEQQKRELNIENGVLINMVIAGSPADLNGLLPNDIITRINDMPITMQDQVRTIIRYAKPGDKLMVYILSQENQKEIEITLGDLKNADTSRIRFLDTKTKHIGVKFQTLSDQLKEYFQTKNGILIAEVFPDSPAEQAGLQAGDIIVRVDEKPVDNVGDIKDIIKYKKTGEYILVDFLRHNDNLQTKVAIIEADEFFSLDMNNEIIVLGRNEFDINEINRWFESVFSDSTRKELEKRIEVLQREINQIRRRILNQQ
jgi:serine protease Do